MKFDDIIIIKKGGEKEPFDIDKFHKPINFACEGLQGVSPSAIALGARKRFSGQKEVSTHDITSLLVKSAQDLITVNSANYQYVAGRLINYDTRKQVYGSFEVPHLYEITKKNVKSKWYDKEILSMYTEEEFNYFNSKLEHHRDEQFTLGAWKQLLGKYLVRDRSKKIEVYKETPQIVYMLVSMTLFSRKENRTEEVVAYYNAISKADKSTISIATPISAGVRTPSRQFSSCVVGKIGDSLPSINNGSTMLVDYASRRAGIGMDMGEIRPVGSPIRGGEVTHTGITPFVKHIQSATLSSSQGGVRAGSSTLYYPVFHKEIQDIIVYKNNKGTDENRVRHVDHAVSINKHFYKKAVMNEDYHLIDHTSAPGLYEAFYRNPPEYEVLYDKAVKSSKTSKTKVKAKDLFMDIVTERAQTGRIYIANIDNVNSQSNYKDPVYSLNLCLEICSPTANMTKYSNYSTQDATDFGIYYEGMPAQDFREKFGEVTLCTLSNINWGVIKQPSDFEEPCRLAVYALDELLDYQDYPMISAEIPAINRRNLGIGVNNLAYWMTKNDIKYGENLDIIDEYMEAMYYYCVKASLELAKEKGACGWWSEMDFDFIFNKRTKAVDELVPHNPKMDWDSLMDEVKIYGLRNSVLMATPPSESNSLIINATNGVEPIREKMAIKGNKKNNYPQVFPNPSLKYDMLWEMDTISYLKTIAVLQKYHDQALSANVGYDPEAFGGSIPSSKLMKDILFAQKVGLKSLYYHNTRMEDEDDENDDSCCKL
ncbi:MAG: ribonucleoside-diphosphate reductase subunit alpha [Thiomicrorhabdus sp.]|jgi:ribonucleoside-diphosphate reductase alpha chain|nr:ribonucleoside-diphosphate reductase subunit alpha [Thiomicrorhabdus sp.]